MKQIREVLVRELWIYFYLQLALLIICWTVFGLTAGMKLIPQMPVWALALITIAITYYPFRLFLMGCVLMYKAYAPLSVREECRFVPTCSTYMLIAIKKYGIAVGVFKGIRRICRCKPPNGGEDWP